jgi:1-hydroxycarotenoid 3,4-desaturase
MASAQRIVVVGAGVGGLCAAARLAHAGMRVTVVEAAAGPGGKMRTVDSAAGPVDAGPTVLTLRRVFEAVFAAAGERLQDHVTLVPQPVLARHFWPDGSVLDLHADAEASAAAIRDWGGSAAERDFRRFHRATARALAAFDRPVMQAPRIRPMQVAAAALRAPAVLPMLAPGMTLERWLRGQFRDARLRQLFGRYATYVGGTPGQVPALLGLIWQAECAGVWVVQGGMHRLALALQGLAERGGAVFCFGTAVDRVLVQGGRVSGVALADGTSLPAAAVVFNGDPAALAAGLLGRAVRAALPRGATAPRSLSARVWSFAAVPQGPDLLHHNVFFTADPATEFGPLARGHAPAAASHYLCAQDRGTGTAPRGPERFEIIQNAPPLGTTPPTAQEDARCHAMMTAHFAAMGLRFDPAPSDMTGPQGFARMFPGSAGSIYGRSPAGMLAAFRRPTARTAVAGLYLCGGGAHPGAGVPMAAQSGLHAAAAILAQAQISASASRPTAMPGGTLTASPVTGGGRSASSGS